jgi:hypothetical protein
MQKVALLLGLNNAIARFTLHVDGALNRSEILKMGAGPSFTLNLMISK